MYILPEMNIYKRHSDTKCMYLMIKDEKCLLNIWQLLHLVV